jgi:hypothetical protein
MTERKEVVTVLTGLNRLSQKQWGLQKIFSYTDTNKKDIPCMTEFPL